MEEQNNNFFNKGAWKAIAIAAVLVIGGEIFLAWQYNRLAGKKIPGLERQLAEQQETNERRAAENVLHAFLAARVAGNEQRALRHLTEESALQWEKKEFKLVDGYIDYEIKKITKQEVENEDEQKETVFRARVILHSQNAAASITEILTLKKVDGTYYIHLVELPG